jgi:PAS domain S-box-containing protein
LIGQTDFDLFPRELAEKYRRDDQQVVASGQAFEAAESHRTPAGEERFVQVVKTPLRDATGQIVGVQGIFWDITERLRAGEALRESEENYRSIVETTAEWIWEMDLTGKHTFSNLGVTGILGYRPEELIGQSAISLLHAEDRPEVETTLLRLMAEKRGWRGWILRWRHQDGSYRYLESNANPILNAASELVGYRGADHDITERKRTEQALKESEELFRSLSASSPVGIFLADLQGHCVYANPRWRAILGLTLGESVGEGWLRAVHPDDREALTSQWSECVRQKREYSGEFRVRPPAGRERWVHMRSVIRHADSSEPTGLVGTLEDITERKRTEEALRESLRRFELLTGVAGDLLLTPDPQELVEGLCRRVMDHLDCHAFFNFLADEKAGRLHLNACAGISEEEARRIEWLDYGVAVCGCSARDGCRIVAENIETTPDPRTELVKSYGIRAYACHPLQGADGKVIGALSFGTRTRDTFSGDDLLLMKAVTDQVAVAMIRVKAHETLRESEEKYRGLFKSSRDAIMTLEPPSWRFTSGNPATVRMFGAKEDAELTSKQPWVWSPERQPDGRPSMDKAMEMIETAMREGSHFFEWTHRRTDGAEFQADVLLTRVEQRGKAILQATVRDITERKQAEEALRKSGEQLRALAERLQAVREEERIQLAREVHDQVGQALTSLNLDVAWLGERLARPGLAAAHRLLAGRLEAMSTLLAQTMGTVQRISSDLRPGMLDDLGLSAAIEWQAEEFATRTGLTCEAHCSPLSRDAGPKCSTAMFRILQELLTNVVRHAQARRVDVELREHAGALILEVRDDGRGIAEEQIHAAKSLGLLGIQERAQAVAGAVEIRGQPGRGTRVTVTVPLT